MNDMEIDFYTNLVRNLDMSNPKRARMVLEFLKIKTDESLKECRKQKKQNDIELKSLDEMKKRFSARISEVRKVKISKEDL